MLAKGLEKGFWGYRGVEYYKRKIGGILVVLELFSILTVIVDTQIYTGDKMCGTEHTHTLTHTNEYK